MTEPGRHTFIEKTKPTTLQHQAGTRIRRVSLAVDYPCGHYRLLNLLVSVSPGSKMGLYYRLVMGALEVMEWVFMKMLCTVPCIWSTLKQVEFSGTLYLWRAVLLNANSCWHAWYRLVLNTLRELFGYFKYVYIPAVAMLTTKHITL